jgi:hypothetical protein
LAVTVAWTRSAIARSSGAIFAMESRVACNSSAFLAPFLPSARNSAARAFIAARSSALKPADPDLLPFEGISHFLSIQDVPQVAGRGEARPVEPRHASPFLLIATRAGR